MASFLEADGEPVAHDLLSVPKARDVAEFLARGHPYARLVESRTQFIEFFRQLSDEQWKRAGLHPERGHFSMWDALMQVSTHDTRHLEQMTRIIAEAKS